MNKTESITLEMSLKPFKQTDKSHINAVCRGVFEQWKPLVKDFKTVKVLLWSSDGSELFDYSGSLNDEFEWAYFIGGANPRENKNESDPEGVGLHSRCYRYIKNPPKMTYAILKNIVSAIKEQAKSVLGNKEIKVGTAVDVGPEFAISDFKYKRHNELCPGNAMGKSTMLCAYERMHADSFHYAAYPDGVPENLPFGTFFGRQAQCFLSDIGFDYIWFSNGLGFGRDVWSDKGALFDGKNFNAEKIPEVRGKVAEFWSLFRKECPEYPIETRGTNMSLGIDNATDGVPLREIYKTVKNLLPPPNSPWAAINGNYGLELMGYMSRIANLPEKRYLFRYYLHDIWWMNSPWYDRYNGRPHDIYLPLAIARISENGEVCPPSDMNILSIDNAYGDMPDSCAAECIPHIRKALKETPDALPPLVWVYPFDEYSDAENQNLLRAMYCEDKLIESAINEGLPLSAVTSTSSFLKQDKKIYSSSVIITPAPFAGSAFEIEITAYAKQGGRVIFYGDKSRSSKNAFEYAGCIKCENAEDVGECAKRLNAAVKKTGYIAEFKKDADVPSPKIMIHRHNNAYIFSQFTPITAVKAKFKMPFGAPVLDGWTAKMENGFACYHFPKADRSECRVFAEQNGGSITCREHPPVSAIYRRCINVSGLCGATVRILGETYCKENIRVFSENTNDHVHNEIKGKYETIGNDTFYRIDNVSGQIFICMPHRVSFD